jgi:7-cyano-7-deazaguanine synthase
MPSEKKAVILLSGGLDSTTVLAIALKQGFSCHCLSFSYGQRQTVELERATQVATTMGACRHLILNLDLGKIGGSALTTDTLVPKSRSIEEMGDATIPVTYVPARNMIFLSHAVAWAEVLGSFDIFVGVNALDYSGYPDCRPAFIGAMEQVANLGTGAGVEDQQRFKIHAPLMHLTKKDIVEKGLSLGVDYSITHSCYDPDGDGVSCGQCDACLLRLKGFAEAGCTDPIAYQSGAGS